MRTIALSIALLVLLAGCPKRAARIEEAHGDETADYYPLAIGNRWTYDSQFLGEKGQRIIEVLRLEDGFYVDNTGSRLALDAFGIRDDKRYILRGPLEVGRTWTNVVSVSSVEHYRIIEFGQSCQVPAGRFEVCVRVEGRNRVDAKTTLVNELTFAYGVGLVRIKTVAEIGERTVPQTDTVLSSYHLAGAAPSRDRR